MNMTRHPRPARTARDARLIPWDTFVIAICAWLAQGVPISLVSMVALLGGGGTGLAAVVVYMSLPWTVACLAFALTWSLGWRSDRHGRLVPAITSVVLYMVLGCSISGLAYEGDGVAVLALLRSFDQLLNFWGIALLSLVLYFLTPRLVPEVP